MYTYTRVAYRLNVTPYTVARCIILNELLLFMHEQGEDTSSIDRILPTLSTRYAIHCVSQNELVNYVSVFRSGALTLSCPPWSNSTPIIIFKRAPQQM